MRRLILRPVVSSRLGIAPARFLTAEAEPGAEEKAKIETFLAKCGQKEHAEKFKTFDELLSARRLQLKNLQIGTKARRKILNALFKHRMQERWAAGDTSFWYSVVPSYKLPAGPLFLRTMPHYEGAMPPTGARPRTIKHPDLGWIRKEGFIGRVGDLRKVRDETADMAAETPEIEEIREGLEESEAEWVLRRRAHLLRGAVQRTVERQERKAVVAGHMADAGLQPPVSAVPSQEQLEEDAALLELYHVTGVARHDELKAQEAEVEEREEALAEGDWSAFDPEGADADADAEGPEGGEEGGVEHLQQGHQGDINSETAAVAAALRKTAAKQVLASQQRAAAAAAARRKQHQQGGAAAQGESFWKGAK